MKHSATLLSTIVLSTAIATSAVSTPPQLRIGHSGHAFDHLGGFGNQAEAAAASGAAIIYATGLGGLGYAGLPPHDEFAAHRRAVAEYNRDAKARGIELSIGYVCATSIVRLDEFDKHWPAELRSRLKTPPAEWRQQDQNGQPLPSWYGGDYQPACMNNPDWRTYEEFVVRQQLETGHDGIFFDNPTVHPQGCYCPHCMERFDKFLDEEAPNVQPTATPSGDRTIALRQLALAHPKAFLRFRATIARDFLAHIRRFARTINPGALITCNNSLNSPHDLYRQSRVHGYNIFELSKAEDFVVVEDMMTQPRTEANGTTFEYGPTYKQLHAISHGKPVVAVTICNGDYHTPPNLVRLAMAEAAAHDASYLSWPTWPEDERARMIAAIRPQADLLRQHEDLLNDTAPRADVVLFLPFHRWVDTEECRTSALAAALSPANIQYRVVDEVSLDLDQIPTQSGVVLLESLDVLTPTERQSIDGYRESHGLVITSDDADWLDKLRSLLSKSALALEAPPTVRAIVRDQPNRTIVHLLNLNIQRLSSFEDKVSPAADINLAVRVPFKNVRAVSSYTADERTSRGTLKFTTRNEGDETVVELSFPRLEVSAILVIDR